jgi:glycosyltransferase involved in cell wall biosynthesis
MRILQVSEDPNILGGIPRYTMPLARRLVEAGHHVDYISSGGYLGRYDLGIRRRWETRTEDGVDYHLLINAKSVGIHSGRPQLDVDNPDVETIARHARRLEPDVIHVHSLLAIPAGVLPELATIAPTVLSVHDYALMCQRRVLVQRTEQICTTYPTQVDCPWCIDTVSPAKYRLRARLQHTPGQLGIKAVHTAERVLRRDLDVHSDLPDTPRPSASTNGHGPATGNGAVDAFQRRLRSNVSFANEHVARVLAVSHSVRDICIDVGIEPDRVDVMHIGSASAERFSPMPLPSAGGKPVTFMFMGGLIPFKGPHVLVDALARMERRPRVVIVGNGYDWYERELREKAPADVEFRGYYKPHEQGDLLAQADVVVAPAVGPDPGPQVVLEALAAGRPVLGSRIGGIPDFVQDEVNGRTFTSEDPDDLARVLLEMDDRDYVARLAENARLPKRVSAHVAELEALYQELAG